MKLVLSSAGYFTAEIAQATAKLVGKPASQIKTAVINEGYVAEHGDHSWVVDDLNRIKKHFPGPLTLVNLQALTTQQIKNRLLEADVIFVVGGHTDYLMSVFNKSGLSSILPEIVASKVYVGSSAGSMVIGQRVSTTAYQHVYGEKEDYGVTRYLELVNFALKPHLGSPSFPQNRPEVLLQISQDFDSTIYGLQDETAIIINGDTQYVIGPDPLKITNGKRVESAI